MTDRIEDGGPAYPVSGDCFPRVGMTLRDAFAIGALPALNLSHPEDLARKAYAIADAMIRARSSERLTPRSQGLEVGRG